MSVASFIPKLWAAGLLVPYHGAAVFTQGSVANRDYQGEITHKGDSVEINSIGSVTISDYDPDTDLSFENVSTAGQTMNIDQAKSFAFYVNDVDKVQAAGDFKSHAINEAGIGLAEASDAFAAGVLAAGAHADNKIGRVKIVSGGTQIAGAGQITAYDLLVDLGQKLNEADVPLAGRYVVVPPAFVSATQKDDRFARVDAAGTSETLRNGLIARAAGFDILLSNRLATVGGSGANKDDKVIVAGVPGAFTFADQILNTEAGRSEKRIADWVRGLNVFGAKVTRPKGIATATIQAFEAGTGATTVVVTP
ncbi:phage major capsid protein [Microbacterium sp. GXF6406]